MKKVTMMRQIIAEVIKNRSPEIRKRNELFEREVITKGVRDYAFHISRLDYLNEVIDIHCERSNLSIEIIPYLNILFGFKKDAYQGLFDEWINWGNEVHLSLIGVYDKRHKDISVKLINLLRGIDPCQN